MRLNLDKPYLISWYAVPLLIGLGLLCWNTSTDLYLHDTYYVISNPHLGMMAALLMGVLGLGYWVVVRLRGRPNKVLSSIHLTVTLGAILFIPLLALFLREYFYSPGSTAGTEEWIILNNLLLVGLLSLVLGQVLYLINLAVGLRRRRKEK